MSHFLGQDQSGEFQYSVPPKISSSKILRRRFNDEYIILSDNERQEVLNNQSPKSLALLIEDFEKLLTKVKEPEKQELYNSVIEELKTATESKVGFNDILRPDRP